MSILTNSSLNYGVNLLTFRTVAVKSYFMWLLPKQLLYMPMYIAIEKTNGFTPLVKTELQALSIQK